MMGMDSDCGHGERENGAVAADLTQDTSGAISGLPAPFYADDAVTLFHADCRDVLPLLDRADVTITDPPYSEAIYRLARRLNHGIGRRYGRVWTPRLAALGDRAIGSHEPLLAETAGAIGRLTRRWSVIFSDAESTGQWRAALEAGGARYIRTGVWVRENPMPQFSGDRPGVGFELCTIVHGPGRTRWNGGGSVAVWSYGAVRGHDRLDHPCPKPLDLMRELVRLFSDPGETILDPFAGSGTTLLAARIEGRRAVGIEVDEQFATVAARRLERGDVGMRRPEQGVLWIAGGTP